MAIKQISLDTGIYLGLKAQAEHDSIHSVAWHASAVIRYGVVWFIGELDAGKVTQARIDAIRGFKHGPTEQVKISIDEFTWTRYKMFALENRVKVAQLVTWTTKDRWLALRKRQNATREPIAMQLEELIEIKS